MRETMADEIALQEHAKYQKAWALGAENQSRTAWYIFEYLKNLIPKDSRILDIGCGNGVVSEMLRQNGFTNVHGVDITLEGLKHPCAERFGQKIPQYTVDTANYTEAPVWDMPFVDNEFDFTFSVDVMEHMPPERVESAIREIYRVTGLATFHCIATFAHTTPQFAFHPTVQSMLWWHDMFDRLNTKSIAVRLKERSAFLLELGIQAK